VAHGEISSPYFFYFGTPAMSETNQARKLKFLVLASIYTYYGYMYNFFCLGASRIYATPSFFSFWTPISPKLIKVGIEIWYAVGCVGLHLVQVALLSQRRRAMHRACQLLASTVQNVE